MSEPTIIDVPEQHRYEISVDGVRAGVAHYLDTGVQRIFHHTDVDKAFGGRGLGTKLIAAALADTRAAGKRIVPMCSFVAAYADKHPEYAAIIDPVTAQAEATVTERT